MTPEQIQIATSLLAQRFKIKEAMRAALLANANQIEIKFTISSQRVVWCSLPKTQLIGYLENSINILNKELTALGVILEPEEETN